MTASHDNTRALPPRPCANPGPVAVWVEAMISEDLAAQVRLGLAGDKVEQVRRGLAVAMLEGIAQQLGLHVSVSDLHDLVA